MPLPNNYDDIYRQFRWHVPARFNIGVDICDRWAVSEPDRLAIPPALIGKVSSVQVSPAR